MPATSTNPKGAVDERGDCDQLVLFYAYGSLLSIRNLCQYTPSAAFVMRAELPNYEVQFRYYWELLQGGTSCIIEAPGQMVHGVLYTIAKDEMPDLDVLEMVPEGIYKRETFYVLGEDGKWYQAYLYRLQNPAGPRYTPAKSYLDDMIEGAQVHGLKAEYTENLVAWRRTLD